MCGFNRPVGKDTVLLGTETPPSPDGTVPPVYLTYTNGGGWSGPIRINFETPLGSERLFGYGSWELSGY